MASKKRMFEFHDGSSDKFWNIELSGNEHTVQYGRSGTDGQTKTKSFGDEAEAEKSFEKLIAQKVKKGYVEVLDESQSRSAAVVAQKEEAKEHTPFLDAILKDPDNKEPYLVYADWLEERGDPRGELIRVQWRLEDEQLDGDDRADLKGREKALLKEHKRSLLGDLADELVDQKKPAALDYYGQLYSCEFQRGFLDAIKTEYLTLDFSKKLKRYPFISLLRKLSIEHIPCADELMDEFEEYAEADWVEDSAPSLDALGSAPFSNLREFVIDGERPVAEDVHKVIKKMPRLETLTLHASYFDTDEVCKLKLPHLKRLILSRFSDNPLPVIAANKSFGHLEMIDLFPHMLEYGDEAYINLEDLKVLCESKNLPNLKHLQLWCSDFGDAGVDVLIESGMLQRLEVLDLNYGAITDAGATRLLEANPTHLKRLNLTGNYLTSATVEPLKALKVNFKGDEQHTGAPGEGDWPEHLQYGDME